MPYGVLIAWIHFWLPNLIRQMRFLFAPFRNGTPQYDTINSKNGGFRFLKKNLKINGMLCYLINLFNLLLTTKMFIKKPTSDILFDWKWRKQCSMVIFIFIHLYYAFLHTFISYHSTRVITKYLYVHCTVCIHCAHCDHFSYTFRDMYFDILNTGIYGYLNVPKKNSNELRGDFGFCESLSRK